MTQKTVLGIKMGLNAEVSSIKMIVGLIFKINRNSICIKIVLTKQVVSIVYPVCCLMIFIFKDKYLLILYCKYFQLL